METGRNARESTPALLLLLRVLVPLEAVAYFLGAAMHLGMRIRLPGEDLYLGDSRNAATVETAIGVVLAITTVALFARRSFTWPVTVAGQAFALAGTIVGIIALAAGRGPVDQPNTIFHGVVTATLIASLIALMTPAGHRSLAPPESTDLNDAGPLARQLHR